MSKLLKKFYQIPTFCQSADISRIDIIFLENMNELWDLRVHAIFFFNFNIPFKVIGNFTMAYYFKIKHAQCKAKPDKKQTKQRKQKQNKTKTWQFFQVKIPYKYHNISFVIVI